jgi:signal transduction histidine kinase
MNIERLKSLWVWHLILPVLLILFFIFQPLPQKTEYSAQKIAKVISEQFRAFEQFANNSLLVEKCFKAQLNQRQLQDLQTKKFGLFFYQNNQLVCWTKNNAIPFENALKTKEISLAKLQNGWFIVFKKSFNSNRAVIGLLPLKYDFNPQSSVLRNNFDAIYQLSNSDFKIDAPSTSLSTQQAIVLAPDGTKLFTIEKKFAENNYEPTNSVFLLFAAICIIIALYFHQVAASLHKKKRIISALAFQGTALALVFLLLTIGKKYLGFFQHKIFQPELYSSGFALISLFDLLILCVFVFWIFNFIANRYSFVYPIAKAKWKRQLHQVALTGLVFLFSIFIAYIIKTLVLDSSISFQLFNLLSLNIYSFIGLVCVTLLIFAHFLLSSKIIKLIYGISLSTSFFMSICLSLSLLLMAIFMPVPNAEIYLATLLWTTAWLLIFLFIYQDTFTLKRISNLLIVVGLYSVLSTYLFETLFEIKERNLRKLAAETLLEERDYFAESNFTQTQKAIEQDKEILLAYQKNIVSKQFLREKLLSEYLAKYLNKYNAAIIFNDSAGKANFDGIFEKYSNSKTPYNQLKFVTDSSGFNAYVAILFQKQSMPIAVVLKPRLYESENLYNRLLADNYLSNKVSEEGFSFAVYKNDKLLVQRGDFNYPLFWDQAFDFKGEQEQFIDIGDWEHNILKAPNQKQVVITVKQESLFEPIALFSYLFTFFLLVLMLVQLLNASYKLILKRESLIKPFYQSFKARLNYAMLFIIVGSFLAIGYITISFSSKQYNNFLNETSSIKEKSVINSINFSLNNFGAAPSNLSYHVIENELQKSAYANNTDVNFFDTLGNLIFTSQPPLFERGIVSKKMNPQAYFDLKNSNQNQLVTNENIVALNYHSSYYQLRKNNQTLGFISFPYFEQNLNADDEINSFLIALLNVYVFLLIGAAVISYFISKSVTRPLNFIAEKMQIVNLGKRNELIEWNSKDEIGVLVKQYNRMIRELENSAEQLAKTEREGAWREMAKQIAHEIKNPLTPMKLSIQYLQKAIDENNPRVNELAARVTKTLVEQIDNLSAIATSFSSFAKMPKGENEPVELNEMLQGICDLFSKEESVNITFNTHIQQAIVFADRNQLLSVFNNLVKNGIQAVPEERKPEITVSISEKHEMIQIEVRDNGIGIAEENYAKVFAPNFTTKSSGTGLGLAIAMQIIESTGGAIWFESIVDVGTAFFVVLPKLK